jgi:hypothetical protein
VGGRGGMGGGGRGLQRGSLGSVKKGGLRPHKSAFGLPIGIRPIHVLEGSCPSSSSAMPSRGGLRL